MIANNTFIFRQEVEEAFKFWGTPEGDLVHPADCMHELLEKVRRHRVNIDGNVCTVMVTTLVLEVSQNHSCFQILMEISDHANFNGTWF